MVLVNFALALPQAALWCFECCNSHSHWTFAKHNSFTPAAYSRILLTVVKPRPYAIINSWILFCASFFSAAVLFALNACIMPSVICVNLCFLSADKLASLIRASTWLIFLNFVIVLRDFGHRWEGVFVEWEER